MRPSPAVGEQRGSLLGVFGRPPEQVSQESSHFHPHVPLRTSLPPAPPNERRVLLAGRGQGQRALGGLGARERGGHGTGGTQVTWWHCRGWSGRARPPAPAAPLLGAVDCREVPGTLLSSLIRRSLGGPLSSTASGGSQLRAGLGHSHGAVGLRPSRNWHLLLRWGDRAPGAQLRAWPGPGSSVLSSCRSWRFGLSPGGRGKARHGVQARAGMLGQRAPHAGAQKHVCSGAGRRCPAPTRRLPALPACSPPAPSLASRRLRLLPSARPG